MRAAATPASSVKIRKTILRLDAFLGEWLSPSYFEFITPPPESVMMLASAKADLLRREDYTHYPNLISHTHANSQSQLWSPTTREGFTPSPNNNQSSGSGSTPNSAKSVPFSPSPSSGSDQQGQPGQVGYVSPVPHYAVSSNNNIPPGYVSHARDACVAIDYQWHSTRSILDWGDGGTFPEEWASMHKRFRAGVQSLVDWYSTTDMPSRPVTRTVRRESEDDSMDHEEDVETESVVILVSHGAGCNALIGAITHQPVLMDVAMASLTMAVRKPNVEHTGHSNVSRNTPPVHELYDLKLFANTDHLRSPVATPTSQRSSTPTGPNGIRGRHSSFSTSVNTFSWNDSGPMSRISPTSAGLSGLRKGPNNEGTVPRLSFAVSTGGITVGSGVTSFAATRPSHLGRTGSRGLWSPIGTHFEDEDEDDLAALNFGFDKAPSPANVPKAEPLPDGGRDTKPLPRNGNAAVDFSESSGSKLSAERSPRPEPEQLGAGTGGLWGVPRPPDDADRLRDVSASKRRWTVTERS
jgi:hypothetical protein